MEYHLFSAACFSAFRSALMWLLVLLAPGFAAPARAQFNYVTNNGSITITSYTGPGGDVIIPSAINGLPVTSIGNDAFSLCGPSPTAQLGITIPNSVTNLGTNAFLECPMSRLTIPNTIATIPSGAFLGCGGLTNLSIPNGVTDIGIQAFQYCYSLTNVVIPNSVTAIDYQAFSSCVGLEQIVLPNSVTNLGPYVFSGCTNLASVTLPNGGTGMEDYAFSACGLKNLNIPGSFSQIGRLAFSNCRRLTNATIAYGVTAISLGMFFDCTNLIQVTIPGSVTNIGGSAFYECFDLTNTVIPEGVTQISGYAFYFCPKLTSVTIPDTVVSIQSLAFFRCSSLASATFMGDAPSEDCSVFQADGHLTNIYYWPGTSGWGTNYDCLPAKMSPNATYTVSVNASPNSGGVVSGGGAYKPFSNRTVTAATNFGFRFVSWTQNGNVVCWLPTYQFKLNNDISLQANFEKTTQPVLAITNLTAGQRLSNGVVSIEGQAESTWGVSNIWLNLNGGGWTLANGTTNWSAEVNLVPGTNLLRACALGFSGKYSPTNMVPVDFVVTNQLGLATSGLGKVSPNYTNAWLEVGRNYTITATATTGFAFTNWLISTNWNGQAISKKATLGFMMASNLTLTANFLETSKPTVAITTPAANQKLSNSVIVVKGTTKDIWQVTNVWCQVNQITNRWPATTTDGFTNWSVPSLSLGTGVNAIYVYAVNRGGLVGRNSVMVIAANKTLSAASQVRERVTAEPDPVLVVANPRLVAGRPAFTLEITGAAVGIIQASTDLAAWETVTNFAGTNTTIEFFDPSATDRSRRFYRALVPQN
jgi:hypothetical protein